MSYRAAEQLRWKQFDFVVGYEIKLSESHPCEDICDMLAGRYPKDFVWTGWHPMDKCYCVSILKTEDEFWDDEEDETSENEVTDVPDEFKEWIRENQDRIETAEKRGTQPYFISDNKTYVDEVLNPREGEQSTKNATPPQVTKKTPLQITKERHAARTQEDIDGIQSKWNERRIANIQHEIDNGNLPEEVLDGLSALPQEQLNKRIAFLQKRADVHSARSHEEEQGLQEAWQKRILERDQLRKSREYNGLNVIDELNKLNDAEFKSLLRTGYRTSLGSIMCGDSNIYQKFMRNEISRQEFMKAVVGNFGDYGKVDFAPLPVAHVTVAAKNMVITDAQKIQIKSHPKGGYIGTSNSFKMNGCLRNRTKVDPYSHESWTTDDDKTVANLDMVISKNHIQTNTTVFRMVDSDWLSSYIGTINEPWKTSSIENAANRIIGKSCQNLSYTSVSFNSDLNVFGSRPICLRIKIPKGTPMYITENYAESEAILGRNTTLIPQSTTRVGNHIFIDCIIK